MFQFPRKDGEIARRGMENGRSGGDNHPTANLCTKILDCRGFDSSRILRFMGWSSHIHGELHGSSESTILSRDNLSRKIICKMVKRQDGERKTAETDGQPS